MGDQCFKDKILNLTVLKISLGKYRYYSEYRKVAKFIGS